MTNTNFALRYERIPSGAMLPDMITDAEVKDLMAANESAEARLRRRIEAREDRDDKNAESRFIIGAAAVAAAVTLLGVQAINYNHAHSVGGQPTPIEQTGHQFVNSGLDGNGNVVTITDQK